MKLCHCGLPKSSQGLPKTLDVSDYHEALMTKESHLFGKMSLHAPSDDSNRWKDEPWALVFHTATCKHGYLIKPEHLMDAWNHPAVISPSWMWE